jgi:diguanylate cyclase (GGDEF)-like protein/PAS domain S-box-containing protein
MIEKELSEEQVASKPISIQSLFDGLPNNNINVYMNQAKLQIGVFFWQWKSESDAVDFLTIERIPQAFQYELIAEEIRRHIVSLEEKVESIQEHDTRTVISIIDVGIKKWFNLSSMVLYDINGKIESVVGSIQDITEWKSMQNVLEDKLDFINILLDSLISPVFYKDSELVYRHCNKAFEDYLGKTREEIIDKTVYDVSPDNLAEIYNKADLDIIKGRKPQIYETKVEAANGEKRNVIFNKSPVLNRDGEITGMIGIINDITERVILENRLKRIMGIKDAIVEINGVAMVAASEEEVYKIVLHSIVSAMPFAEAGCILKVDKEGKIRRVTTTGLFNAGEKNEVIEDEESIIWNAMDGHMEKCFYIKDIELFSKENNLKSQCVFEDIKVRSILGAPITKDGKLDSFIIVSCRQPEAYDETDLFIMDYIRIQVMQILEKQELFEKNLYMARRDSLTGLFNRRHFMELFDRASKYAHRYNQKFQLVSIDLDQFKKINDQFGHHAGDTVLTDFAKKLTQSFRESDIVARYGGDEFILVLFNADKDETTTKLEKLRLKVKELPINVLGTSICYSFSYGISEYPTDGTMIDPLCRFADYAMYAYKKRTV